MIRISIGNPLIGFTKKCIKRMEIKKDLIHHAMRIHTCLVWVSSILAISCSMEDIPSPKPEMGVYEIFSATIDEQCPFSSDTKVYADKELNVLWNADDCITIFNKTTSNQQFRFLGGDGDKSGQFTYVSGSDHGSSIDKVYAVYPYDASTGIDGSGVISFQLPAEQTYRKSSFGSGSNTMVSRTEDNELRFKNVGGYLAFQFYGAGVSVSSITLKGNKNEFLAGGCLIDMSGDTPVTTVASSGASTSITLTCEAPVELGASRTDAFDFWFVLPPMTFTKGFTVTVMTSDGGVFEKKTDKSIEIKRSFITRMSLAEVVPKLEGNIVFADDNFKAYCVNHFDRDGDGAVSYDEAKLVKEIDVDTKDIASLVGIEHFTNLESLTCGAKYQYGFVTGGWHLFNAEGEEVIGLLTSLDLSKNTRLEHLNCDVNQLTSLDLSANSALKDVSCKYNYLATLVAGSSASLTEIHCMYNRLTSIDVSGCTSLESLECFSNNLKKIDVSKNVALTRFSCYRNDLRTLDVSNNLSLNYLSCESNPLLMYIWLKKGQTIASFYYDSSVSTVYYKD